MLKGMVIQARTRSAIIVL